MNQTDKEIFVMPEVTVIRFGEEDVITTSTDTPLIPFNNDEEDDGSTM